MEFILYSDDEKQFVNKDIGKPDVYSFTYTLWAHLAKRFPTPEAAREFTKSTAQLFGESCTVLGYIEA